jgi:hypothetical protein
MVSRSILSYRYLISTRSFTGIVKTHRLLLLTPTSLMTPGVPDFPHESRLTIGPRAIKDIVEQFPPARGSRSDPQLIWHFDDLEVEVKSLESSIDAKGETVITLFCFSDGFSGQSQLSTELTISTDEFDVYNVHSPPITIAFHLKEFNVGSDLNWVSVFVSRLTPGNRRIRRVHVPPTQPTFHRPSSPTIHRYRRGQLRNTFRDLHQLGAPGRYIDQPASPNLCTEKETRRQCRPG